MPKAMNATGGYVFTGPIDLAKSELKNPRAQNLATAPTSPVAGQFYFDTSTTPGILYWYSGSSWVAAAGGVPSGAAGGALTGTYPNPTLAAGSVGSSQIIDGSIVDADVATANKDGLTTVPSLRTLGTGAQQAAAGNDSRLSDSRAPSGTAAGSLAGTYPNPTIAAGAVGSSEIAAAIKDPAATSAGLRTLGTSAAQAAAGNDSRLSDTRTPTAGSVVDASVSATAAIALSKLAVDPRARSTHTGTQTASTVSDFDTQVRTSRLDQMAAPIAAVPFGGQRATGLADPTSAQDAATKNYVDNTVQGLDAKASVRVATTANITLSGTQTIDGVAVVAGDRVLVKNQTDATTNGVYLVAAGAWTRTLDMDTWAEVPGSFIFVEVGTVNADNGFVSTADQGGTLGTTAITWVQFSGAGQITAGSGLTKTGNTLAVGAGTGIVSGVGVVSVDTTVVGRRVVGLIGDGTSTLIPFTHGLGNQYVHAQVFDAGTNALVDAGIILTSATVVTIDATPAPAANAYRVVVIG